MSTKHNTLSLINDLKDKKPKPFLNFKSPSELATYEPPKDFILVGDCHLTRGSITVVGGNAGIGKSRLVDSLSIAGATGKDWMGLPVHSKFKTLIIQVENGEYRLKKEMQDILESIPSDVNLDDFVKITTPPTYGFDFNNEDFCEELREWIADFEPSVIVIDPWNRVVEGSKQEDYRNSLDAIMSCLPEDPCKKPAIVIVHHLRKPSVASEKKSGRDLLHELAGSYQLGSAARCVFCLEAVTKNPEDNRVLLTCCKNNDGKEGSPTAWTRSNGLFAPELDFNVSEYLNGTKGKERVTASLLGEVLGYDLFKNKKEMVKMLEEEGIGKSSTSYKLLTKFEEHVKKDENGMLYWDAVPELSSLDVD